jgi:hypothetical protein
MRRFTTHCDAAFAPLLARHGFMRVARKVDRSLAEDVYRAGELASPNASMPARGGYRTIAPEPRSLGRYMRSRSQPSGACRRIL